MEWTYGTSNFAKIDPEKGIQLRGRAAAGRFRLRFELSPLMHGRSQDDQVRVLWLAGSLTTQSAEVCLLSPAERCSLFTGTTAYDTGQMVLAADLSFRQLNSLNEARGGDGSLQLYLSLWGLAAGNHGLEQFYGQDQVTVGNERWQGVLQECNFAETVLIEVVTPKMASSSELVTAVKALADAKVRLFLERRPNDAVSECRHALDVLRESPPLPTGVSVGCSDGRRIDDLALAERVALLKYALRHVSNFPHHDKSEISQETGRLIVQLTAVLLEHELRSRAREAP